MRVASPQIAITLLAALVLTAPSFALAPKHKRTPAAHHAAPTTSASHAPSHTAPQQHSHAPAHHDNPSSGMDPERATQIQAALIKAGYLTGTPSGTWDADSIAAMQKLQEDNGWQSKIVPDARALIKLGLGPHPDTPTIPQQ